MNLRSAVVAQISDALELIARIHRVRIEHVMDSGDAEGEIASRAYRAARFALGCLYELQCLERLLDEPEKHSQPQRSPEVMNSPASAARGAEARDLNGGTRKASVGTAAAGAVTEASPAPAVRPHEWLRLWGIDKPGRFSAAWCLLASGQVSYFEAHADPNRKPAEAVRQTYVHPYGVYGAP